jgi:V/A-type H+-transporting ATPase subunit D
MGCTYYQYEPVKKRDDIPFEEASLDPALTSPYVDELVEHLVGTEKLLWTYINLKVKLKALEKELKRTMRKVNTLEHTVLPDLRSDLKRIADILDERERQERFAVKKFSKSKKSARKSPGKTGGR